MKILVIEDDAALCKNIAAIMEAEGYETICCKDGDEGLYYIENKACDAAVLDRMLPGIDGIELLRRIRARKIGTPVLMLSAMNTTTDRIQGLDAGADDYLNKPFEYGELVARIRALVRRPQIIEEGNSLQYGDLVLDLQSHSLRGPLGCVSLTKRESAVLELFLRNKGQTLTKGTLFNRVWGPQNDADESNVATYIAFLRRRLAAVGSELMLVTHRGAGFSLANPREKTEV